MSSSKMVNDRSRSAALVAEAAATHAGRVGVRLDALLKSLRAGDEQPVDWSLVIKLLGRALARAEQEMVRTDIAHEAEKADDPPARAALEEGLETLYREVVDFRIGIDSTYGSAGTRAIGFAGNTPRESIALVRLASLVVESAGKLATLTPARRGLTLDASAYIGPITEALKQVQQANAVVLREVRELETTQVAKHEALSGYDSAFLAIGRTLEGLLRTGDEPALAERVRPSVRRPGRTESQEEPPEPSSDGG